MVPVLTRLLFEGIFSVKKEVRKQTMASKVSQISLATHLGFHSHQGNGHCYQ